MTTIYLLFILLLSVVVGFELIRKVPATLHTPLMSGANAISGISLLAAMSLAGGEMGSYSTYLGAFAACLATINVVGGYMVTDRMLAMFKAK
ncbi:NAD(P) transhydrogenase subunit alpha [Psychrosphaera sp. B3R10]|uniref:NAD(P) transhydrogenase subunit alpha n=1 Tax=unclassified Psychrosphaera TaxID=2641570 RepID=UPI001C08B775|nr:MULTISPECIES: NAD(P) transhydrogenase subunit alpha [unclassified Psychrosphaera]MBU2881034.1 NAD(P) transhydrogenase subunit alpha [Psychrosphaera sp. I2R16]MBU2989958.1 NAD(P) transhydrogenase subunit alpha [Psychrosphaera sp. B3R10]MDO6719151.1 NAD(P) transhydrogenase subunit alpha [Psychrosphaera sp. 1_MG-2023]